jgi:Papain fold toxin 2
MKKVKIFPMFLFLLVIGKANAQTTQAFKDAAFAATSTWNNQNTKCKEYARSLETFVKANATKYAITSYKFYELKAKNNNQFINHDDFSTTTAISTNGIHVIAIINGEVFDNHHPKGAVKTTWDSKLFCPSGGYPAGFTTTLITNIQTYL